MDCLNSIAPTDEELISLALDEETLPEDTNSHLQQCEICQQRLARYKQVNTYLLSHLYRSQCPTGEELSLYCADLLPAYERMRIANHVLDCPLCTNEVAETRKFLRTLDVELNPFGLLALFCVPFLPPESFVRNHNLPCVVTASKHPGRASTKPNPSISHFIFPSPAKVNICYSAS